MNASKNKNVINAIAAIMVLMIAFGIAFGTIQTANAQVALAPAGNKIPKGTSLNPVSHGSATTQVVKMLDGAYGAVAPTGNGTYFEVNASGVLYHQPPVGAIGLGRGSWVATLADLQSYTVCYPYGVADIQIVALSQNVALVHTCDEYGNEYVMQAGASRSELSIFLFPGQEIIADGQKLVFNGGPMSLSKQGNSPVVTAYFGNDLQSVLFTATASHVLADYGALPYVVASTATSGCVLAITTDFITTNNGEDGQLYRTCVGNKTPVAVGSPFKLGFETNYNLVSRKSALGSNNSRAFWFTTNQTGGLQFNSIGDSELTPTFVSIGQAVGNFPASDLLEIVATDSSSVVFGMRIPDGGVSVGGAFSVSPLGVITVQENSEIEGSSIGLFVNDGQIFGYMGGGVSLGQYE